MTNYKCGLLNTNNLFVVNKYKMINKSKTIGNSFGIIGICIISILNLLYMHYTMYVNNYLQILYQYSVVINFLSVCFDVSLIFLLFYYLTGKRVKTTIFFLFSVTLIWSLVNVLYSRFFFQYLPLSAINHTSSLFEDFIFNSVLSGLRYSDFFYLISIVLFIICYKCFSPQTNEKPVRFFIRLLLSCVFFIIFIYSTYFLMHKGMRTNFGLFTARMNELVLGNIKNTGSSVIDTKFHSGSIRTSLWELFYKYKKYELTKSQISYIENEYSNLRNRVSNHTTPDEITNVVIVLLESFISAPIDLIVDGQEITPFLNRLKREKGVYYNGKMQPNITIGESGDGQFIYMTGLLPLQDNLTVQVAKDCMLPALPKLLNVKYTEIVIPSLPNVWEQSDMNIAYGISNTYSRNDMTDDNVKFVDDEKLFKMACNTPKNANESFFSMVLSISTHMPYETCIDTTFNIFDKQLSHQYISYLNACHYMDKNLELYIADLKNKGLYDNSLIVITADHHAHLGDLNMGNQLKKNLPLYIVNGSIDLNKAWKGEINQLDVYTTILDILNINCKWHGLGKTILLPDYKNSVSPKMFDISKMIIETDYFRNNKVNTITVN